MSEDLPEAEQSSSPKPGPDLTPSQKLQQKYFQLCAELGNIGYQQHILESQKPEILKEMQRVNQKGQEVMKAEQPKEALNAST